MNSSQCADPPTLSDFSSGADRFGGCSSRFWYAILSLFLRKDMPVLEKMPFYVNFVFVRARDLTRQVWVFRDGGVGRQCSWARVGHVLQYFYWIKLHCEEEGAAKGRVQWSPSRSV